MQADHSVELGRDDPALEVPWAAEDGSSRFLDLRRRPELLLEIAEAGAEPVLAEFLATINGAHSRFSSAKCDCWSTREISPEEEIFGAPLKQVCYVDLFFDGPMRHSLEFHQGFVHEICRLLHATPEIGAAIEFAVRRCYFHRDASDPESEEGFYLTAYISGYGDDEDEARLRWSIALKLLQNAIIQMSSAR